MSTSLFGSSKDPLRGSMSAHLIYLVPAAQIYIPLSACQLLLLLFFVSSNLFLPILALLMVPVSAYFFSDALKLNFSSFFFPSRENFLLVLKEIRPICNPRINTKISMHHRT